MKKVFLLLLAITVIFLVACKKNESTSNPGQENGGEIINIPTGDFSEAKIEGYWEYQYPEDDPKYSNFTCDYGAIMFDDYSGYHFIGTYTREGNDVNIHFSEYEGNFVMDREEMNVDVVFEFIADDTVRVKEAPTEIMVKQPNMTEEGEIVINEEATPITPEGLVEGYTYKIH